MVKDLARRLTVCWSFNIVDEAKLEKMCRWNLKKKGIIGVKKGLFTLSWGSIQTSGKDHDDESPSI